jgi:hypothetical protein
MFGYATFSQAPFATLGGGVEFNRAIIESSAATESAAALASLVPEVSVSAAITDTATVAASIFNALTQDTASGSSTVDVLAVFQTGAVAASKLTDADSATADFAINVADFLLATDTVEAQSNFVSAVNVLATILDSAIGGLLYNVDVEATATGTDAPSANQGHGVSVSDVATITDASSALQGFAVNVADTASGTATPSALADFNADAVATANALDAVAALAVFYAALTDNAVGADAVAQRLLWEIINDSQNANWQNISDAQTTTWSVVKTQP